MSELRTKAAVDSKRESNGTPVQKTGTITFKVGAHGYQDRLVLTCDSLDDQGNRLVPGPKLVQVVVYEGPDFPLNPNSDYVAYRYIEDIPKGGAKIDDVDWGTGYPIAASIKVADGEYDWAYIVKVGVT